MNDEGVISFLSSNNEGSRIFEVYLKVSGSDVNLLSDEEGVFTGVEKIEDQVVSGENPVTYGKFELNILQLMLY